MKKAKRRRPEWDEYFINIAKAVSERATCLRRRYGAVVAKDNIIIATGYNGAPRGMKDCLQAGRCTRKELQIPHGERYELCMSVHAEANAIIRASMAELEGATIYIAGFEGATAPREPESAAAPCRSEPCMMCKRMILNAKINRVVYLDGEGGFRVAAPAAWLKKRL